MNVLKRLLSWRRKAYRPIASFEMQDLETKLSQIGREEKELFIMRRRINADIEKLREERRRLARHHMSPSNTRWAEIVADTIGLMRLQLIEQMDSDKHFYEQHQHEILGTSQEEMIVKDRLQNFEHNQWIMEDCMICLEFAMFLKGVDLDLIVHKCNARTGYTMLWGNPRKCWNNSFLVVLQFFGIVMYRLYLSLPFHP